MKVELFDDKLSFLHLPAGFLSYFFPFLFCLFIFYEIVEAAYKREERKAHFLGDFCEYCVGLAAANLLLALVVR